MTTMEQTRDLKIEEKLRAWNLKFRFEPEFPVAEMRVSDWAQVRAGKNIAPREAVEQYATQMANGAIFPPCVLFGENVLADGNTRRSAAIKIRRKTLPVYIVDIPTPALAKTLAAALNQMGGEKLTPAERAEAARNMMAQQFTDEAIAREIGITIPQTRRIRSMAEFQERLERAGQSDRLEAIRADDQVMLNRIQHTMPFLEAVDLVSKLRPDRSSLKDLVNKVADAPSDADAINEIARLRTDVQPSGPPPHRPVLGPVHQANLAIGGLLKWEAQPDTILDLRPEQRAAVIDRWQRIRRLAEVALEHLGHI